MIGISGRRAWRRWNVSSPWLSGGGRAVTMTEESRFPSHSRASARGLGHREEGVSGPGGVGGGNVAAPRVAGGGGAGQEDGVAALPEPPEGLREPFRDFEVRGHGHPLDRVADEVRVRGVVLD